MCVRACVLVLVCRVLKCALVCLYLCACSVCLRVLTCVCVCACLYVSRQSRRVCTFVRACRQSACVLSCVCVRAYFMLVCRVSECVLVCLYLCAAVLPAPFRSISGYKEYSAPSGSEYSHARLLFNQQIYLFHILPFGLVRLQFSYSDFYYLFSGS